MTVSSDAAKALETLRTDPSRAEQLLVERLLDKAVAESSLAHDVLALSALPRSFDRRVLAVLVERAVDDPSFEDAFAFLVSLPFVHERRDGALSLHDTVREPLLRQWERGAVTGLDRADSLERLCGYYVDEYEAGRRAADALARAGPVIRAASLERFRAAAARVEDCIVRPAIEAQHVAMQISPTRGRQRFESTVFELEGDNALNLVELVVRGFAEDAAGVADDEERELLQAWASYYEARLANSRSEWRLGEERLDAFGDVEELDPKLATWIESERARTFRGQSRFGEQLAALDREIALHETLGVDTWNHFWPWRSKAEVHSLMWDSESEIAAYETALARAESAGNDAAAVSVLLGLSSALTAVGDPDGAARHIVSALRRARIEGDRGSNRQVASHILTLLGGRSARLLNMAAAQYRHLVRAEGPAGLLDVMLERAQVLAGSGAIADAVQAFDEARRLASDQVPDRVAEVDVDRAGASPALGEHALAAQRNLDLLLDPRVASNPWTNARCLTNAALSLLATGELDEAIRLAREARPVWGSMPHERAVAITFVIEADALRKRGDLAGAAAALAQAVELPARGYDAAAKECAARLALDRGDPAAAARIAIEAVERTSATDERDGALRAVLAVECLTTAGDFAAAAQMIDDLRDRVAHLAAFASWRPTEKLAGADEHGGRAVRTLVAGTGSLPDRIRSAREHLNAAIDLDPDLGWFHLELALLDVKHGRARQAAKRLGEAIERIEDEPLRKAVSDLRDRVAAGDLDPHH
ncbi:MAG: hypothetical protein AB7Q42_13935 [Acidimicrobiia bacterium]